MIRVRGPIVGLWAIGLALAGLAAWGGVGPRGARPVFLEVDAEKDATLSITWAGDTMIADGAKPYVADHGFDWVFERLAAPDADVVIVNHEAPLTSRNAPLNPNKTYSYMSDPAASQALAAAGVTVLGLANNHALDMGPAGLADTIRHAEAAGLVAFGAGMNDREAERPLIVRGGGVTVGIVALGRGYGTKVTAGRKRAGTVPLSARSIKRGYELARKAGAEHVVAYVHWGANYQGVIEEQRLQAAA
ncbi:MAG: CapA family protein, partial [Coriobacteriia bacterium]|nr:CapA family protein [Coriobacteriia bacterium]